jgi:hypothetical protein
MVKERVTISILPIEDIIVAVESLVIFTTLGLVASNCLSARIFNFSNDKTLSLLMIIQENLILSRG